MQILKAIVDTQRTNTTIGYVNTGDVVKLNLQVISNGEIGDNWVNPVIELHGIKSDKKRVRQTDNIQIVDLANHHLEITLHEQFMTCDGLVRLQLVIKDDGGRISSRRISSSVFYLRVTKSLEMDVMESHDYIQVFDDFDTYMELVKEFEAKMKEDVTLLEAELQKASDLSQSISNNEAERQEAFEMNESNREVQFNASQLSQTSTFTINEAERQEAFEMNESNREVQFNQTQQTREDRFNQDQNTRETQFNASQLSQTSTFTTNEEKREELFVSNENNRQNIFLREEIIRNTNESVRNNQENQRVNAEVSREERMNGFETKANELTVEIEEQIERLEGMIDAVEASKGYQVQEADLMDYMGVSHPTLHQTNNSNVEYAVKTAIGEMNYMDYEGKHITANHSIEGRCKSAILKGNTLVNIAQENSFSLNVYKNVSSWNWETATNYVISYEVVNVGEGVTLMSLNQAQEHLGLPIEIGKHSVVRKTNTTLDENFLIYCIGGNRQIEIKNLQIVKGNDTSIPFFTGMQSVKMPVLTTTGKNLFNPLNFKNGELVEINGEKFFKYVDGAKPFEFTTDFETNKQYTITFSAKRDTGDETKDIYLYVYYTDGSRDYRIINGSGVDVGTITTSVNKTISKICGSNGFSKNIYINLNVSQLEEGSIATSYEPYKSNILTVNEDVTLRGIGDVQDELDLPTGELTQRIGETVLDGSQSAIGGGYIKLDNAISDWSGNDKYLLSDKLPTSIFIGSDLSTTPTLALHGALLYVRGFNSNEEITEYFRNNPTTVQYRLAKESIKTVDLSDNVVYSYDEVTHYDGSSESGSLVPTVAVKVPTDVNAVISSQRATIQEQTEQINTLEKENTLLTEQNEKQDVDIALNQDAINFMLFEVMGLSNDDANELNPMAIYFANQILKGKLTYTQVIGKYPQFKDDIDSCLLAEGCSDLIVKID